MLGRLEGTLHTPIRHYALGVLSDDQPLSLRMPAKRLTGWEKLWHFLKREKGLAIGFPAFLGWSLTHPHDPLLLGLVTTAGVGYMASDFAANLASPRIGGLSYHDCGTGATQGSAQNITGATNASPIVFTIAAHGYTSNEKYRIASVGGNTNANGDRKITVVDANTFTAVDAYTGAAVNGNAAYTSGGTSTRMEGLADTALSAAAGTARVLGTPSNPAANQYRSIATIPFTSTLALVEWGLFSALTVGTMWDHRIFTAGVVNVSNGYSITFQYTLTIPAGGS